MMEENGLEDDTPTVVVPLMVAIYIRRREEAIQGNIAFRFARSHLDDPDTRLDNFMVIATNTFYEALDRKSVTQLILSDELFNKMLVQTEDVTTVSIYAPSLETLNALLED